MTLGICSHNSSIVYDALWVTLVTFVMCQCQAHMPAVQWQCPPVDRNVCVCCLFTGFPVSPSARCQTHCHARQCASVIAPCGDSPTPSLGGPSGPWGPPGQALGPLCFSFPSLVLREPWQRWRAKVAASSSSKSPRCSTLRAETLQGLVALVTGRSGGTFALSKSKKSNQAFAFFLQFFLTTWFSQGQCQGPCYTMLRVCATEASKNSR